MTKTFKLSAIFFITVAFFIGLRILAPFVPVGDNWLSWGFSFLNQVVNMCLLPIVLYKLFVSKSNSDLRQDFRLKSCRSAKVWALTAGIAVLVYFLTMALSVLNQVILQLLGYTTPNSMGTIYSSPWVLVMEIVTGAMFPAFCEEFADRGLMLAVLDGEKNDNKKIVLMAVMFGLLHQNIQQFGYAIFGGFVFAYLAIKTHSIFPGMLVHFVNNFMSVMVDYSMQKGNALGKLYQNFFGFINSNFIIMMLIWTAMAALLVLLLRLVGQQEKREPLPLEVTEIVGKQTEIQSLFGFAPTTSRVQLPLSSGVQRREYGFFYAAMAMATLATIFSFVFGLMR